MSEGGSDGKEIGKIKEGGEARNDEGAKVAFERPLAGRLKGMRVRRRDA
jgi:hypothetical protein